jgi:hypothetical protein
MSYVLLGGMVTALTLWSATISFAGDNSTPATTDAARSAAEAQQSAVSPVPDIVWEEAGSKLELFAPIIANGAVAPTSTENKTSGQ